MTPFEAVAIAAAGLAAGMINTIVGSGSLITFPTLLAFGYPPVVANVSNTVGLVFGGVSGVVGYRREIVGQRARVIRFGSLGAFGGLTGAALLLLLPEKSFATIVPFLILIASGLVAVQPRLARALTRRRPDGHERSLVLALGVYLTGVYGGYFGAAQSVILFALLAIFIADDLQRLNGLKNVIAVAINAVAAVIFVLVAPVAWGPAILIAIGSIVGGQLGAFVGRRLRPGVLRGVIVAVGLVVAVKLLIG